MRVLVTGGAGFIGAHLVENLKDRGHSVRVFDIKKPHRSDIEFIKGDILLLSSLKKVVGGIDYIFHLAAFSNIDLVKSSPLDVVKHNIVGTANLLEVVRTSKKIRRLVFASSVYACDHGGHLYTTSKLASENLIRDYHQLFQIPYTILRYGTAYGPGSRDADVISIFVRRALSGRDLEIHGTGAQRRNFIYVEDIAEATVKAMGNRCSNKTLIIAGPSMTIGEIALKVRDLIAPSVKVRVLRGKARMDDYRGRVTGLKGSQEILSWKPKVSLDDGIVRYADWYKKSQR